MNNKQRGMSLLELMIV
ncbi:MAG: prepilin-type N-terminal cleavage/methylation domain-containing protein, partial [Paraglaciecola sp.]|nr:prepilin-type N-terminal cleavage/methylation domain-containing protein [Paraglaciecola sp.]